MDGLEVPATLAGGAVERHDAVAEQVGALAVAAVEVDRRRGERDEDHAALFIDAHRRPGVGAAALSPRVAFPGVVTVLAGTRHGVEAPDELAGTGVKSTDVATRPLRLAVADPSADDQHVAAGSHGRGDAVAQVGILVGQHALLEVDDAVDAEVGVELMRFGVDAEETPELIGEQDALALAVGPIGEAAVVVEVDALGDVELGVELPELRTGVGIERQHAVEHGDDVKNAVDEQRRGLERRAGGKLGAVTGVAVVVDPCDLELADVAFVDLVKR